MNQSIRIADLGLPPLRLDALGLEGCSLLTDAALDAFFAAGGSIPSDPADIMVYYIMVHHLMVRYI